jgi:hypothetical protein
VVQILVKAVLVDKRFIKKWLAKMFKVNHLDRDSSLRQVPNLAERYLSPVAEADG